MLARIDYHFDKKRIVYDATPQPLPVFKRNTTRILIFHIHTFVFPRFKSVYLFVFNTSFLQQLWFQNLETKSFSVCCFHWISSPSPTFRAKRHQLYKITFYWSKVRNSFTAKHFQFSSLFLNLFILFSLYDFPFLCLCAHFYSAFLSPIISIPVLAEGWRHRNQVPLL